jgi:hypothetical protein
MVGPPAPSVRKRFITSAASWLVFSRRPDVDLLYYDLGLMTPHNWSTLKEAVLKIRKIVPPLDFSSRAISASFFPCAYCCIRGPMAGRWAPILSPQGLLGVMQVTSIRDPRSCICMFLEL